MYRDALRGFLQVALLVGGGGFVLAFFQPRDSAEFVVSICSGIVGVMLLLGVLVLGRITR